MYAALKKTKNHKIPYSMFNKKLSISKSKIITKLNVSQQNKNCHYEDFKKLLNLKIGEIYTNHLTEENQREK